MKLQRISTIVGMEVKRQFRDPLVLIFTVLLVPLLILLMGFAMADNYGWHPEYSVFEIMLPGLLAYACLLTIYDVAASVAGEMETGVSKRMGTTPLTTLEYIVAQMISYTIKPLIQILLGLAAAFAVGFQPANDFVGYILVIVFLIVLTFSSVGFGLLTSTFATGATAAGGLAFAFIVPQQIFATFIPPEFMGAGDFKWIFPSFYATDGLGRIFAGDSLTDSTIWARMLVLLIISIVVYIVGIILLERKKRG